jgi:hypothetical protein
MLCALQAHPLIGSGSVDYREDQEDIAKQWFQERAPHMDAGTLALWAWSPQEGWQYLHGYFRVTTHGKIRPMLEAPEPPPLIHVVPWDESALEFSPDDFPGM